MFPAFRQRVLVTAVVIIGGLTWLGAAGFVRAADLSQGLAVADSDSGIFLAVLMLMICGIPAMLGAILTSATGHRLAGPFVIGSALCFLAIAGGSSSGYLWRSADADALPGAYGALMVEMIGWAIALAALLWALNALGPPVHARLPTWLIDPLHRLDEQAASNSAKPLFSLSPGGMLAGLISAAIGGVAATLLVARADTGQLIGGLGLSFIVAGLLSRLLVGQSNPTGVLLSPAVVGIFAYAWVWLGGADQPMLLEHWYDNTLPRIALPLPIHYLSAGLAGVAAGFGLGQTIVSGQERP